MDSIKIEEFLNGLGSTPDQIANTLQLQGYIGDFTPMMCPLAIAVNRAVGLGARTMVFPELSGNGWVYVAEKDGVSTSGHLSETLTEFARKFDQMEYPDLTTKDRLDKQAARVEEFKRLQG